MTALKKPIPFGKYYLLERINVGGMAEVFKAKAFGVEGFERLVAVKRILPNIAEDEEFITMFIDEAKIAVQLKHANIAQIFDLGKVDDSYFIALEYVHGKDLRAIFDRCKQQAGDGCRDADRAGLLRRHEGVRGARLRAQQARRARGASCTSCTATSRRRTCSSRYEGEVKLIDFGIAKAAGKASKTQAGHPQGQVRLHVARAGARAAARSAQRHLRASASCSTSCSPASGCSSARATSRRWRRCATSRSCRRRPTTGRSPTSSSASCSRRWPRTSRIATRTRSTCTTTCRRSCTRPASSTRARISAAWMKKTFAKEIEEETAKLEQYRADRAAGRGAAEVSRRAAVGGRRPADGGGTGTRRQAPRGPAAAKRPGSRREAAADMGWDDEELDTQIFDKETRQAGAAERPVLRRRRPHGRQRAAARHARAARPPELVTPTPEPIELRRSRARRSS